MRRIFLLLAVLWAVPVAAQIIPPTQGINVVSSGSCVSGNCATWNVPNSAPSLTAQITGTMTSMTVTFEGTADGQTWFSVAATKLSTGVTATTTTTTGQYAIVNPGLVGFRLRCTTYASGGVNVTLTRGSASAKSGVGGGSGGNADNHTVAVGTGVAGSFTSVGPGAVNTVLHGQGASADPSFAAVVEGDLSLTDITTANATSGAHGFLPKLSGNAYDWFNGGGTFSQTMARGTITTSSPWTFTSNWNAGAVTFTGIDINTTVTAAANGSAYLRIENAGGDVFGIYKDSAISGTANQVAPGWNQSLSGSSQDFALRGLGGAVALTTSPTASPGTTRTLVANGFSANIDTATAATVRLVRTEGVKVNATLPVCWTSTASAQDACDTGLNRTSAGVLETNNGTPGTLRSFKGGYLVNTVKDSPTAPTIASGGCTSPAVTSSNGTAAFLLTIGTSCTGVKTIVLTMPAATTFCVTRTTHIRRPAADEHDRQPRHIDNRRHTDELRENQGLQADFTASDTLLVKCSGE
jgi:hypothetical protein